tara:strand:- start:4267 stop:5097 length:831 start_codon:yes stop_codon:yes gene_type:complete
MRVATLSLALLSLAAVTPQVSQAKIYAYPRANEVIVTSGRAPTRTALDPSSIRILNWNMYKGSNRSWESDFLKLTSDVDIALLQEVYLDHKMSRVFRDHPSMRLEMATSFILASRGYVPSGTAIGSDVKMKKLGYRISEPREPVINTPKAVTYATFPIQGTDKELLTLTIHAVNFVSSKKLMIQLEDIAKIVRAHKGPVVWAGDFNTWSKKKTRLMHELMNRLGLTEAPFGPGRMKVFGRVLDYVFYKGLELRDSYVLPDVEGADHKPMMMEFYLP